MGWSYVTADLNKLTTELKNKADKFIEMCKNTGISVIIYNTYRTKEEQAALYLQGRATLEIVNGTRKQAGLLPITQKENVIVTQLKDSPHCHGLAFDFVPLVSGKPAWNNELLWQRCGSIVRTLGLEWGGDWKDFPDKPHVQIKDWKKYREI